MRKALVCSAVLSLAGAVSPVWAGKLYVPVVKSANGITHATELYVANSADGARNFSTVFLKAETDGSVRQGTPGQTAVAANGSLRVPSGAPVGEFGLIEVDAANEMGIGARLLSTAGADRSVTRVPVISSANAIAPGVVAHLAGLERQQGSITTDLFLVNLAASQAQCEVKLFRADGSQIVPTASVRVAPLSLRPFADALGFIGQLQISDARLQTSCDRTFYTFASVAGPGGANMSFLYPSASGQSTLSVGVEDEDTDRPLPPGTTLLYENKGVLLVPSPSNEVYERAIPVQKALSLKRMVIELDFTIGPWNPGENDGPHAIIWLYRGSYRSNTIANLNVHGPNKNKIRGNQNVDMPGLSDTIGQQGGKYEVGKTYHFTYTYDAENNRVHVKVTQGGTVINDFSFAGSAAQRKLTVPASGLNYVLGHRSGLHYEVTSYGWTYSNLRVAIAEY